TVNPPAERPPSPTWQRRIRTRRLSGPWELAGATVLMLVVSTALGWMAWSLVGAPSRTREKPVSAATGITQTPPISVESAGQPTSVPGASPPPASGSSIQSPVTPPPGASPPPASGSSIRSPVTPPPGTHPAPLLPSPPEKVASTVTPDDAITPARAKPPAQSFAGDRLPPAAIESAPGRPRDVGRSAAGSVAGKDPARVDAEARDPTAI